MNATHNEASPSGTAISEDAAHELLVTLKWVLRYPDVLKDEFFYNHARKVVAHAEGK